MTVSRRYPEPPYCSRCEWDGKRLVSRCFLCARDRKRTPLSSWSAADLLDPEPVPPVELRLSTARAFGWQTWGRLQVYRSEGVRIVAWVGWHRELRAQWSPGTLTLRWRRYGWDG